MIADTKTPAIDRVVTGTLRENCYLLADSDGEALVVDPGDDPERIAKYLTARELRPIAVFLTHAHDDHIAAAGKIAEPGGTPIYMHSDDAPVLRRVNLYRALGRGEAPIPIPTVDVDLANTESLQIGNWRVGVLHTPGHTPGSVCLEIAGQLLTGDTIFAEGSGRTDLPEGDRSALATSLALLAARYSADTPIHPGHGESALLGEALSRAWYRSEPR